MNFVQPASFLTLHYRLAEHDGTEVVNTFNDTPATLSLGRGEMAPTLEAHLYGLSEGARAGFELRSGELFGERNPLLLQRVKRSLLQELSDGETKYSVGDVVTFPAPQGRCTYAGVVRELGADWVLFDFNHPLAGVPLTFDVHVVGIL